MTTQVKTDAGILRVYIKKGVANLHQGCDIMIDQMRAIDNKWLIKKVGDLPTNLFNIIKGNILIVLDLE